MGIVGIVELKVLHRGIRELSKVTSVTCQTNPSRNFRLTLKVANSWGKVREIQKVRKRGTCTFGALRLQVKESNEQLM